MPEAPSYPVPRSRWVERSDSCATCGKKFTFFTSKTNCPCCGKLCCSDCVQAECAIASDTAAAKVCIDCFSMLQSSQSSRQVSAEPSRDGCNVAATTRTPAWENEHKACNVSLPFSEAGNTANRDGAAAVVAVGECSASPSFHEHVNELLKKSESLREENSVWLTKVREQKLQIVTLREERDRALVEVEKKQKYINDVHEEWKDLKKKHSETRDQLNECRRRLEAMTVEASQKAAGSNTNDEAFQDLQERISRYEKEVARLSKIEQGVKPDRTSIDGGAQLTRKLPVSLVQDTFLDVVAPKPRGLLGAGVSIRDWGFDTFALASRVPSVLQTVAAEVAVAWEFFATESEAQSWARLAAAVENNYRPNPYHNAVHAADVLQGVFALVTAAQPMLQHMTDVERKAVAFAAMSHDVRHPGRTSAFLAAVHDPMCYRFCGRGMLEQMHAATAFEILAVPEFDFTSTMDDASFLEFKNIVAQLILHTDMTLHRESVVHWGTKAASGGFDCTRPEDRVDALSLLLHAADIGATARGVSVAKKWQVVIDEFAEQAADERRRGLPVTPGFDRPQSVERSQILFLDFFVIPLFDVLQQLFPAVQEPLHNLRALREDYAAAIGGVATPFPSRLDYRSPDVKLKEMEVYAVECQKREEEIHRYLEDMKAAGGKLKKKSAALKAKEIELNEQLQLLLEREHQQKKGLEKAEEIVHVEKRELQGIVGTSVPQEANAAGNATLDTSITQRSEALAARERRIRERESALEVSAKDIERREKKLATLSERLVKIAENVHDERRRIKQLEECEPTIWRRASAVQEGEDASGAQMRLPLTQWEAEERLARKYNEVDELLLIVRSMRVDCVARRDNELRMQQLCATMAEREAAISEAVELSRQRRRQVAEGRAARPLTTQLDRLENAIFQLTSAITFLAE
ncbi:putative cAMP phosphodiesterase A [Trypanosoma grayi]|uniref:putative cAMP phosphodiesterase A n=1 Tax=Trypanosoma grayi TaxID=71804 RepID=UPI0004F42301|nr:putative cAMP phosphodiesterase A [Trypanosoma grayi]KEG13753.1 putative cAMP phosphodiesterase A [Trypanosoma grayi]